jgi:hypothetical protein
MSDLNRFLSAIENKQKVRVQFYSQEDKQVLTRTCAPLDYGPSRIAKNPNGRFHLWDYDSSSEPHILSLLPDQVYDITVLKESFDPATIVTWNVKESPWATWRDWGKLSGPRPRPASTGPSPLQRARKAVRSLTGGKRK